MSTSHRHVGARARADTQDGSSADFQKAIAELLHIRSGRRLTFHTQLTRPEGGGSWRCDRETSRANRARAHVPLANCLKERRGLDGAAPVLGISKRSV